MIVHLSGSTDSLTRDAAFLGLVKSLNGELYALQENFGRCLEQGE